MSEPALRWERRWECCLAGRRSAELLERSQTPSFEHLQMNQNDKVSLGCGTLILIALIVMIFGNMGRDRYVPELNTLQQDMQRLQDRMQVLEGKIDDQTAAIEALRREIQDAGSRTNE